MRVQPQPRQEPPVRDDEDKGLQEASCPSLTNSRTEVERAAVTCLLSQGVISNPQHLTPSPVLQLQPHAG